MSRQRVLVAIGTRPEAIKMAPVILELRRRKSLCTLRLCVTGQHRRMLDQMLEVFGLKPDIDLNVMSPNQTLAMTTSTIVREMDRVLAAEKPDWLLVHGDTATTMASALAAFYRRIKVGH